MFLGGERCEVVPIISSSIITFRVGIISSLEATIPVYLVSLKSSKIRFALSVLAVFVPVIGWLTITTVALLVRVALMSIASVIPTLVSGLISVIISFK